MGRSLGEGMRGFKQSLTGDPTATQISSETNRAGLDESRHG
jgi:Sec-independent protein translocase protein TatA